MGRQTQTKSAGRPFLEELHLDKNTSWLTEQNGKYSGSQQRQHSTKLKLPTRPQEPARIRGMLLCLPCHRQRGCELFQLPMPEHTSDEAEKAKEVSQMSTQKPQELWNRELPRNGRRAKNKNILWISLISRARGSPFRPTDRITCIIWK